MSVSVYLLVWACMFVSECVCACVFVCVQVFLGRLVRSFRRE